MGLFIAVARQKCALVRRHQSLLYFLLYLFSTVSPGDEWRQFYVPPLLYSFVLSLIGRVAFRVSCVTGKYVLAALLMPRNPFFFSFRMRCTHTYVRGFHLGSAQSVDARSLEYKL